DYYCCSYSTRSTFLF
nr:immunoglobulin light chain junction region [Macaca mulatta]